MKQLPLLLLCLLLTFTCALSACNQPPAHADVTDTADVSDTQDTVKASDTAADTETDAVTEPAPTIPALTPVIEESNRNLVISQLREPITVEIIDGVTIDLNYHGWPTLCSGDGDTVYAVSSVRRGHLCPFGAVAFSKSEDGGLTWTDTEIIVDTPIDERDAGIVYLGDSHIVFFWFTMYPDRYVGTGDFSDDWKNLATPEQQSALEKKFASLTAEEKRVASYAIHSTDYGETWGDVVQLPINMPHGATVAQDGKTLLCYGMPWASGDVPGFDLSMNALYVMKSENGGYTWDFMSSIGLPANNPGPGYCTEPHVIQLDDTSYLAAYRNQDSTDMTIFLPRSEDGKKWTTPPQDRRNPRQSAASSAAG